jgi:hypothetical protein
VFTNGDIKTFSYRKCFDINYLLSPLHFDLELKIGSVFIYLLINLFTLNLRGQLSSTGTRSQERDSSSQSILTVNGNANI